jgi:UDP-N-acetylmuramoyl-L-alanyl-D-glutamate--2,6-diaminopimelate ligase
MANIAEKCADHIIITDDNPRFESSKDIAADIIAGLQRPQQAFVILDRAEAIQTAVQNANDNDIVLIAGKGHEVTQIVGEQVLPFDDAEQVQRALHARSVNSTRGS